MKLKQQISDARKYNFIWVWRFLFTWGWNGKQNTFSVSLYNKDLERSIFTFGEY